ncbi:MAG TPA: NAD(P)/FAD-dependent oxidoreductase [Polyangium sp.]|nr:NAD(P)/FAD-dependent oxidoreductase [Polyangium sp.]
MRQGPALDVEVLIVGGGPAGLSTALFLRHVAPHLRERILLIEKSKYPREKICAGAVGARADLALAAIGVRVDVPHVPIRGLSVRANGKMFVVRRDGPMLGRVVRRIEFDQALANQVRERNIPLRDGVKVDNIVLEPDCVRVSTSAGDIRTRVLVGADGVGSIVRRLTGFPRGTFMAQAMEVDTAFVPSDGDADVLHFDLEDRGLAGYAWDFPTIVHGKNLVCRGMYELRGAGIPERGGDEAGVAEKLKQRNDVLGVSGAVRRFAERGISFSEVLSKPRVLLVGEAAGIDPVLGEGIAQAILYGAVAGPYLAESLARNDISFVSWKERMRSTRLGLDLAVRSRAAPYVYAGLRPLVERYVTHSRAIVEAGMKWFAGERIPRRMLVRAGVDLGWAVANGVGPVQLWLQSQ